MLKHHTARDAFGQIIVGEVVKRVTDVVIGGVEVASADGADRLNLSGFIDVLGWS